MELKKLHERSRPMQAVGTEPAGFALAEAALPEAGNEQQNELSCWRLQILRLPARISPSPRVS